MKTFFITNRYSFLETQVNEYMQSLLVKTPEQVILYFERQIRKYKGYLQKKHHYPECMVQSIHRLIEEYSLSIIKVKKYISYQNKLMNKQLLEPQ
ncbi:hypothetical protein C2I27_19020 [Priestia megaterium]|uniref:hypothetical protein n=1 Tax=Priestia TaxID=2800373 RepID=UPI000D524156|nr:hypothetical protein [Priestia megaterium]PVC65729.1 hypothetical protein C2I27_19020 [Priestia megaterium]